LLPETPPPAEDYAATWPHLASGNRTVR